jgi:DNA-binding IclR family transcriptional regulator
MKDIGMAAFAGPVVTAWRDEVTKVITKEMERLARDLLRVVQSEAAAAGPALPIKEAEGVLQPAARSAEGVQLSAEKGANSGHTAGADAKTRAVAPDLQEKIQILSAQLSAREEELNRLYNLTESDPKYQAYHVLRDLSPNWVEMSHVGHGLGLPTARVKRLLEEFQAAGLVEIEGEKARTLQLIRKADTTKSK